MRYYRRTDPAAIAYIEALVSRAAEMGVTIDQLRNPYAGGPTPNARTTPPFARVVGVTSQDYFYVAARRDFDGVAEALAALTEGIPVPEEGDPIGSPERQMQIFRTTPQDAAAYRDRLRRAAVLAGEQIYDYAADAGA